VCSCDCLVKVGVVKARSHRWDTVAECSWCRSICTQRLSANLYSSRSVLAADTAESSPAGRQSTPYSPSCPSICWWSSGCPASTRIRWSNPARKASVRLSSSHNMPSLVPDTEGLDIHKFHNFTDVHILVSIAIITIIDNRQRKKKSTLFSTSMHRDRTTWKVTGVEKCGVTAM